MASEPTLAGTTLKLGARKSAVLWGLFFLICFGLGYPTLNRYDAHKLGADWPEYYKTVLHQDTPASFPYNARLLVPAVARPFYLLARGRCGTWDPVWFGLLVANSLFMATAASLLLRIGLRVLGDLPLALLACTLYLLNYVVPNLWLSGMVDSAEACLLLAVTWALFADRWWLLPFLGILGGMAKQSFLPFASTFALVWWLLAERPARRYGRLVWVAALAVSAAMAVVWAQHVAGGQFAAPWTLAKNWDAGGGYPGNLLHSLRDQQFWYAFIWLLPLGVWRLRRLPGPWVAASLSTGAVALALAGYADLLGTVNRPLFSAVGPVLTVSAVMLLVDR